MGKPKSKATQSRHQHSTTTPTTTTTTSPQPTLGHSLLELDDIDEQSIGSSKSVFHGHNNRHSHSHGDDDGHNHDTHSHNHNHNHNHNSTSKHDQSFIESYQNEALSTDPSSTSFAHINYTTTNNNNDNHSHVVCSHTQMAPDCGHNECQPGEDPKRASSQRVLKIVTCLCFSFMCIELVGGYLSGSLAIMTDAAHLLSDLISFMISLLSLTMASKNPTSNMTFGYHRAEILGALISVFLIWGLTVVLVYESIHRIINPDLIEVHGGMMLVVAIIGFVVNIIMGLVLLLSGEGHNHSHGGLPSSSSHGHSHEDHGHSHDFFGSDEHDDNSDDDHHSHEHGENDPLLMSYQHSDGLNHGHGKKQKITTSTKNKNLFQKIYSVVFPSDNSRSININAAILHVLGDLMQSVGVIFAALIIWFFPSWKLADPLCTLLFSVIVITTTTRVMKQGVRVLMEGTPDGIDSTEVAGTIREIPSVVAVHDLHIWSLSVDQPALAVHLVVQFDQSPPGSEIGDGNDFARTPEDLLNNVNAILKQKYHISHTTIQLEEQYKTGVCIPKATVCKRPSVSSVELV